MNCIYISDAKNNIHIVYLWDPCPAGANFIESAGICKFDSFTAQHYPEEFCGSLRVGTIDEIKANIQEVQISPELYF